MHLPSKALLVIAFLFIAGALGAGCRDDDSASKTRARQPAPPPPSTVDALPMKDRRKIYADLALIRDRGVGGDAALRATARRHRVSITVVRAIAREGTLKNWPLPPAPRRPRGLILSPGRRTAATQLTASTKCSGAEPRKGVALLHWRPAARRGSEQRVVVTIFRNFVEGRFESSGRLSPGRATFEWHRVHGQAIHSWRVLTRQSGGWAPSVTRRFTGPTCLADMPPTGGPLP